MKKNILFLLFLLLFFSCLHKNMKKDDSLPVVENIEVNPSIEVKEEPKEEPKIEKKIDYRRLMIETYEKLIISIKKRNYTDILSCYVDGASYGYKDSNLAILKCYDGSYNVSGVENVKKQYDFLFKKRLLDNIEFEIENIDEKNFVMKIINLWANEDFGVYEYLYFTLENENSMKIVKHYIVKEKNGRQG